ncbi:hypothetical protein N305_02596, partial [Manacus vitellinus]
VRFRSINLERQRQALRGSKCGDAADPGEASRSPRKSFFFVKGQVPWNGFAPREEP